MRISLSVKVFVLFSTLTAMTLILSTTTYLSNRQNSGATEQVAFLKNFLVQIENMGFLRTKSFYLQKIFYKENFDKNIRKTKDLAEIMGKSYKDYPILIQKKLADIPLLVENFSHSSSELFDYYDIHNQLPKQNTKIFKLLKKRGKTLNDMETHFFYNSINNLLILQMKVYHQHDISNLREIKKLQNEIGSLIQDKATINLFNQVIHNIEMNYLNALEMKKHEAFLIQTSNHFCKVANETISVIVEKNSKRQNIQSWIIFIISAVAICLNILFWILSSRYFQSFIKTHKETIRAIEKGDYPHEFNKTSNDEIGDLSDAMKNMDNSLQKNKERYLKLVNQAPDAIYVVRVDGRIIDVNEQACKSLGYSREALLQMRISEIDPESVDENNKKYLLDRLEIGDNFNSYGTHIKKDNTIFPVEARIGVHYTSEYDSIEGKIDIPEGKIFMAFARDISGRKLAENALSDSEEKYRAMMESMNDEVCICSSDLVIEFLNSAMIKRIGYDATGEKCYKALHGLDEKCSWCSIEKVLEGKSTNYEIVSPKDGKNFNMSNTPIFNTDGSVSKLTIFRDLTEFKKIMVQLQQAQKMESIGTLSAGIAHDFNNILFPILGHSEMLLMDIPEDSPFKRGLSQIHKGAMRASDLIKQILSFSRQETGSLKVIKIQHLIKEVLKLIRSAISSTIEIQQNIQRDCGAVKADPTQIHQVIMNLATNAFHSMKDTGGVLTVNLKEVEISEPDLINSEMLPGTYAWISVIDTGVGLDKELLKKIFEPFFTTKERGEGTGMGLAVILGIVKSMNGVITVNSEPDKGSEFHVYLPIANPVLKQQIIHVDESIQSGTEHILLVDDEKDIIDMEKNMLELLGYKVTSRLSSIDALEAFRAAPDKFDLIITDLEMPNMAGNKLAMELIKIRPDIPVFLCTGFSETFSEDDAKSLGIKDFLLKPIIMKDLSQKIRTTLDKKKTKKSV